MSCYCSRRQHLGCVCCNNIEDYNLSRLKSTNDELKSLIKKIDQLSGSFTETRKCYSTTNETCSCYSSLSNHNLVYECNVCRDRRLVKAKSKYEYVLCEDCEHMLWNANKIQTKPIKIDHNVYPLEKYHCSSQRYSNDCEKCRKELREKSRSRSRSRTRSARSFSPLSRSNSITELRPIWNGGPFKQSYQWRDEKLKENS